MSRKQVLLILASVVVSVASVAFILAEAPLEDVIKSIERADAGLVALAFALSALALVTRGIRWWGLLGMRISPMKAFHFVNIMFLGNQLPMRLGEVARGVLAAREGVPLATAAASIVLERLMDTLLIVLLLAATVSQLPSAPRQVTDTAAFFGIAGLAGFGIMLYFARQPDSARKIVDAMLRRVPPLRRLPLQRWTEHLLAGLTGLADGRMLVFSVFWTLLSWVFSLATFYCLQEAMAVDVNPLLSVPLSVSLAAFGIALPVSIAAIGPFEGAIIVSGQLVGMDSLTAVSLGFLFHGVSVFSVIIWGCLSLLAIGVSPRDALSKSRESVDESA